MYVLVTAFVSIVLLGVYFACNFVQAYVYDGVREGPTVLLIAGMHGNEKSGTYAANIIKRMLDEKKWKLDSGRLVIIPNANPCGGILNRRNNPFMNHDPNRQYNPQTWYPVNQVVMKFVHEAEWIVDLHEGRNYRVHDVESLGNGMYFTSPEGQLVAHEAVSSLNRVLHTLHIPKFMTEQLTIMPNALDDYSHLHQKNYLLIETTGQNNQDMMEYRVAQHIFLTWSVIYQLKMSRILPQWRLFDL